MKAAQPDSVIWLAPGLYDLGPYQFVREPAPNLTIQPENLLDRPIIRCPASFQIRGSHRLTFRSLDIDGRLNLDNDQATRANGNALFHDITWTFSSPQISTKDMLKVAHVPGVVVSDSRFLRTVGVTDRPIDVVHSDGMEVRRCYFRNPLQGAVQIKGGSHNPVVSDCVIYCDQPYHGQRAIQLGGSSCFGCWGWDLNTGDMIRPADVGYEVIDGAIQNNIVYNCVTPFVASTGLRTTIVGNTAYCDPRFSFMFLFRCLQEDAFTNDPNLGSQLNGQEAVHIERNLWLYHANKINGSVFDVGGIGRAQDVASFHVEGNAFYAVSPITNSGFGSQNPPVYAHRHVGVIPPRRALDIRVGWLDQINPHMEGVGASWFQPTASDYKIPGQEVGARILKAPVETIPISDVQPPVQVEDYPDGTPFYGWEGAGISTELPTAPSEPPTEPDDPAPVVSTHYEIRTGENPYPVSVLDTLEEAQGAISGMEIWRVDTTETKIPTDDPQ